MNQQCARQPDTVHNYTKSLNLSDV
jgi:hypothetical protein